MNAISRSEAVAQGLKHYFTGKPCSRGHVDIRMTSTGVCLACSRENSKAFREKNPEKIAATKRKSRIKHRDANIAYSKSYREKNGDRLRAQQIRHYHENKELMAQRSLAYRTKNRDALLAKQRSWRENNKHRRTALQAKRKARQRQAIPAWFSEFDAFVWEEAAALSICRRDATGIDWHADHMIPLAARNACGLHVAENCQVIPQALNNQKHNKMILTQPGEWIRHLSDKTLRT